MAQTEPQKCQKSIRTAAQTQTPDEIVEAQRENKQIILQEEKQHHHRHKLLN